MYLIISVVELVAWIYYKNEEYAFPRFYFSTIGYWGSIVGYIIPPFMAIIQITGGNVGDATYFPGNWATFLIIVGGVMWLAHGLLHIFYVPGFLAYIDAQPPKACECDLPVIAPLAMNASDDDQVVREAEVARRDQLCKIQCPDNRCQLPKGGLSDEEYDAACSAASAAKSDEIEGATQVDEDDASTDDASEPEEVSGVW